MVGPKDHLLFEVTYSDCIKQIQSSARILKTVREDDCQFKLEQPINEILSRMREISLKILKDMKPHPHYLLVSLNLWEN
jgi:hypothetical protein